MNGFLTPYPGAVVAGHVKKTFDGNLSGFFIAFHYKIGFIKLLCTDVSDDFLQQIRVLVTALLSPASRTSTARYGFPYLSPKRIADTFVTGKTLFDLFVVCFKFIEKF